MTGRDQDHYERMLQEQYPDDTTPSTTAPRREHLHLVPAGAAPAPFSFATAAQEQHREAIAKSARDLSGAPTWFCESLRSLAGPMLPGELVLVGGVPSNGKSAVLKSQVAHFADVAVPTLYCGLETGPIEDRRELAAWYTGLDKRRVARNQLTPTEVQQLNAELDRQLTAYTHVVFAPQTRLTVEKLEELVVIARKEIGVTVVMVDHFHRMDFGMGGNRWERVTEAARQLRDMARSYQVVLLVAAQLSQSRHPIDRYLPPRLDRLKETGGLGEEANVVFTLSRVMGRRVDHKLLKQIEYGGRTEKSLALPRVLRLTDRKHRLENDAMDESVLLIVDNGRVREPHYQEIKELRHKAAEDEQADANAATPANADVPPPPREPGEEDPQEGLPF